MRKLIILGVCCVCTIFALATSGKIDSFDRTCSVEGVEDCVEREDRRSDGYSQRLPRSEGPPRVERQSGWRPEYLPGGSKAAKNSSEAEGVSPLFPPEVYRPNCLIVWTADWCSACEKMNHVIKRLREEGYIVYIIDYDYYRTLAQRMNIRTLPTCIINKNGREIMRHKGPVSAAAIKKDLKKNTETPYDIW